MKNRCEPVNRRTTEGAEVAHHPPEKTSLEGDMVMSIDPLSSVQRTSTDGMNMVQEAAEIAPPVNRCERTTSSLSCTAIQGAGRSFHPPEKVIPRRGYGDEHDLKFLWHPQRDDAGGASG